MSKAEVLTLVSKLKLSETEKIECGKRLIAFYDSLSPNRDHNRITQPIK